MPKELSKKFFTILPYAWLCLHEYGTHSVAEKYQYTWIRTHMNRNVHVAECERRRRMSMKCDYHKSTIGLEL